MNCMIYCDHYIIYKHSWQAGSQSNSGVAERLQETLSIYQMIHCLTMAAIIIHRFQHLTVGGCTNIGPAIQECCHLFSVSDTNSISYGSHNLI